MVGREVRGASALGTSSRFSLEGQQIGRYRLLRQIGAGGMATVYEARVEGPAGIERRVALKLAHPHLANDPRFVAMFLDEVRLAARIQHPNVCGAIDIGQDDGVPFLVMELLDGCSLSQLQREARGPIPPRIAARIVCDAAHGLHAAHELRDERGAALHVVHRDVSPQNLMVLRDGTTKVLDFGVARARDRLFETTSGGIKGKVSYMAPEQLVGAEVDRRADVWALGLVLCELATGEHPFRGESSTETAQNVLNGRVRPPAEQKTNFPEELDSIILDALRKDPAERTSSAASLADRLESYLYAAGEPTGPRQVASALAPWLERARAASRTRTDELATAPREHQTSTSSEQPSAERAASKRAASEQPAPGQPASGQPASGQPAPEQPASERPAPEQPAPEQPASERLTSTSEQPASEQPTPDQPTAARPPPLTSVSDAAPVAERAGGAGRLLAWISVGVGALAIVTVASRWRATEHPVPATHPTPATAPTAPLDAAVVLGVQDAGVVPERDAARASTPTIARARGEGHLRLMTIPPSEVFLGHRSLGRTPLLDVVVPAGTVRLRLVPSAGGIARAARLTVPRGETVGTTLRLEALPPAP